MKRKYKWMLAGLLISAVIGQRGLAQTNMETTLTNNAMAAAPAAPMDGLDGRKLFLKNCAHCHGADAHGDDGPDLHDIDWTPEQIMKRVRTGKKGQMTAFEGKLTDDQIKTVAEYVKGLK